MLCSETESSSTHNSTFTTNVEPISLSKALAHVNSDDWYLLLAFIITFKIKKYDAIYWQGDCNERNDRNRGTVPSSGIRGS